MKLFLLICRRKIKARLTIFERTIDIPFTAKVLKTYDDGSKAEGVIRGTWFNVKSVASSPRYEASEDVTYFDCISGGSRWID